MFVCFFSAFFHLICIYSFELFTIHRHYIRRVIKVNQDPLGIQGTRVKKERKIEVRRNRKVCLFRRQLKKILRPQTWVRPITPIVDGSHSYAVAWSSKRDDGLPYAVNVTLETLGLKHAGGYMVMVWFNAPSMKYSKKNIHQLSLLLPFIYLCRQNLFSENVESEILMPHKNFTVRINPSGL